jgi:NADPH:quinone reductase-like Zn-dependent oxidoreductase
MADDLTETQKQEYERWKDYANALLVASTVLFAGTAIAFPKAAEFAPILSSIFGLLAIVLTVFWYALEWNMKTKKGKPVLLLGASCGFGLQIGVLIVALFMAYRDAVTASLNAK